MNKKLLCASLLSLLCLSACGGEASPNPATSGTGKEGSSFTSELSEDAAKHTVRFYVDGGLVKTISVKDGSKMSVPSSDELPKGYIIDHWYVLEGTLKSPWSFSGGTVTSDLDLYADFEYETYTVTLLSRDGAGTYEYSIAYKQEYNFSGDYRGKADHFENEEGAVFAVSGIWEWTHGETLTPVYGEGAIKYYFYEIITSFNEDGYERRKYESLSDEELNNPNPKTLPGGKSSDLDVVLLDASKEGYRFEGWFKSKSKEPRNRLDNLREGYFGDGVYGLFSRYYSLSVSSNYENAGRIEFEGGEVLDRACAGEEITVKVTPNDGYYFEGWYNEDVRVNKDYSYSYTFKMPSEDYSLTARFQIHPYYITYELDGGVNNADNIRRYTVEDEILLKDPTKTGYEFKGWYSDSSYSVKVTSIPKGSTKDMTLYAKWEAILYSLDVSSTDESKGGVSVVGEGYTDEKIAVTATSADGYVLKGWYADGELVSKDSTYIFSMPAKDYSLKAVFWTKDQSLGITPFIDSAMGEILTYGLYPQTHVQDEAKIASLDALTVTESNGWYLLNGEYYVKMKADIDYEIEIDEETGEEYYYDYFEDGTPVIDGTKYWFKCEPIEWKILSSNNGEYSLVSAACLDSHRYNAAWSGADSNGYYCNNYARSEIREWLNADFYDSAFSLGNSLIQTTTVDNSASTTGSSSNVYACANTSDKVYLLSYEDYCNAYYGFSTSSSSYDYARRRNTTDWARANVSTGYYWTRSPHSSYSNCVWYGCDGDALNCYGGVSDSDVSVRPAITIKIAQ